ncbi:MAG: exodeoxyribonuclease VII small subunit [Candidatus Saccharibacteria bacterium]|nr:exodeoxyribonuclease VII small subunit [Candidatus Saccharibacteria bacterium]
MAEKKTISQKIAELDELTNWFYSEDFSLDKSTEKYQKATNLAKEIEEDLKNLKNEITVIDKDFAKE